MKIPNFASLYHWGRGWRLSDSKGGSYLAGAWARSAGAQVRIKARVNTLLRKTRCELRIEHLLCDSQLQFSTRPTCQASAAAACGAAAHCRKLAGPKVLAIYFLGTAHNSDRIR